MFPSADISGFHLGCWCWTVAVEVWEEIGLGSGPDWQAEEDVACDVGAAALCYAETRT